MQYHFLYLFLSMKKWIYYIWKSVLHKGHNLFLNTGVNSVTGHPVFPDTITTKITFSCIRKNRCTLLYNIKDCIWQIPYYFIQWISKKRRPIINRVKVKRNNFNVKTKINIIFVSCISVCDEGPWEQCCNE